MGVIAVVAEGDGARLLWYDQAKPRREGPRWVPRARLYSGRLGPDGKLVPSSRKLLHEGDRAYGHVEGHEEPRLLSDGRISVYLGRRIEKRGTKLVGEWEVTRLAPFGALGIEPSVVTLEPLRLARPEPIQPTELGFYAELGKLGPGPAPHPAPQEPARVAWLGDRGWFLQGAALRWVQRGDPTPQPAEEPFEARRSPSLVEVASAPRGEGLAYTSDGLVLLERDRSTRGRALDDPGFAIRKSGRQDRRQLVGLGRCGQGLGGALTRLPTPSGPRSFAEVSQAPRRSPAGSTRACSSLSLAHVSASGACTPTDPSASSAATDRPSADLVAAPASLAARWSLGTKRGADQRIWSPRSTSAVSSCPPTRAASRSPRELRLVALPAEARCSSIAADVGSLARRGRELRTEAAPWTTAAPTASTALDAPALAEPEPACWSATTPWSRWTAA